MSVTKPNILRIEGHGVIYFEDCLAVREPVPSLAVRVSHPDGFFYLPKTAIAPLGRWLIALAEGSVV